MGDVFISRSGLKVKTHCQEHELQTVTLVPKIEVQGAYQHGDSDKQHYTDLCFSRIKILTGRKN
jgi:hypothetical protein